LVRQRLTWLYKSDVNSLGIHAISPEEERKATVGGIYRNVSFSAWNEGVSGDGILIIISMNVSSMTTV